MSDKSLSVCALARSIAPLGPRGQYGAQRHDAESATGDANAGHHTTHNRLSVLLIGCGPILVELKKAIPAAVFADPVVEMRFDIRRNPVSDAADELRHLTPMTVERERAAERKESDDSTPPYAVAKELLAYALERRVGAVRRNLERFAHIVEDVPIAPLELVANETHRLEEASRMVEVDGERWAIAPVAALFP